MICNRSGLGKIDQHFQRLQLGAHFCIEVSEEQKGSSTTFQDDPLVVPCLTVQSILHYSLKIVGGVAERRKVVEGKNC